MYIYNIVIYIQLYYTSSTAQGGRGSFKHTKLMGEVNCCDAWMAERPN